MIAVHDLTTTQTNVLATSLQCSHVSESVRCTIVPPPHPGSLPRVQEPLRFC